MVALIISLVATIACGLVVVLYARRRPPGAPITWGEAMVAAMFAFFAMFIAYGILPHQWLAYADNDLQWRKDKLGIPAGPLGALFGSAENDWVSNSENAFFPKGIPLASGHLTISAEAIRDIIATLIYVVGLGAQIALWSFWQKRGQQKPKELPTSAYGRPLVKKA